MCYSLVIRKAGKEMYFPTSVDGGLVFSQNENLSNFGSNIYIRKLVS